MSGHGLFWRLLTVIAVLNLALTATIGGAFGAASVGDGGSGDFVLGPGDDPPPGDGDAAGPIDVSGIATAALMLNRLDDFSMRRLLQHLDDLRIGRGFSGLGRKTIDVADAGDFWPKFGTRRMTPFVIGRFVDADIASATNRLSSNLQAWGATLGVDVAVSDDFILGLAASYADGRNKAKIGTVKTEVDSVGAEAFGSWRARDGLIVDVAGGVYWLDHGLTRQTVGGVATAKPEAKIYTAQTRLSAHVNELAKTDWPLDVIAFAALYWARATTEAYVESGPGAIAVGHDTQETFLGEIGVSLYRKLAFGESADAAIIPQLDISFNQHFRDDDRVVSAQLVGQSGIFPVEVVASDESYVRVRPSLGLWLGESVSVGLSYETLLANRDFDTYHEIRAELKIRL